MTFNIKIRSGSQASDHKLELQPLELARGEGGQLRFVLDGAGESQSADWVEIAPGEYSIILQGRSLEARVTAGASRPSSVAGSYTVAVGGQEYQVELRDPRVRRRSEPGGGHEGPQQILAPMPGKIVKVLVNQNEQVDAGRGLVVIEAMKMQNELRAPRAGRVESIYVSEGMGVETGFKLLRIS
jgi:biotin carboxyl carrier protein